MAGAQDPGTAKPLVLTPNANMDMHGRIAAANSQLNAFTASLTAETAARTVSALLTSRVRVALSPYCHYTTFIASLAADTTVLTISALLVTRMSICLTHHAPSRLYFMEQCHLETTHWCSYSRDCKPVTVMASLKLGIQR